MQKLKTALILLLVLCLAVSLVPIAMADSEKSSHANMTTIVNAQRGAAASYDLSALFSGLTDAVCADLTADGDGFFSETPTIYDTTLSFTLASDEMGTLPSSAAVSFCVSSSNYEDFTVTLTVSASEVVVPILVAAELSIAYSGMAVGVSSVKKIAISNGAEVPGTWSWVDAATSIVYVADSGVYTLRFTPDDTESYAVNYVTVSVTVQKATPSGTPGYTSITSSGYTLADAALTTGDIDVAGIIAWELDETTEVVKNTAYTWIFTPTDTDNYEVLTGTLRIWKTSSSGSSSGGSSSGSSSSGGGSTTGIRWTFNSGSGVLSIYGTGYIADYSYGTSTWREQHLSVSSVVIGSGVTRIGDYAFSEFSNLVSVSIPDTLTSIGDYAFDGCESLTDIYYGGDTDGWNAIQIGNSNIDFSSATLHYNNSGTCGDDLAWTLKDGMLLIFGSGEMDGYTVRTIPWLTSLNSITSVLIGAEVTSIGKYAFYGCSNLTTVTMGNNISSIGNYAFYNCNSLQSIVLGDNITSIGDSAFDGCTSLESITIPNGITEIGKGAFSYCGNLSDIYYSGSEDEWNAIEIGDGNTNLTSATIHYTTTDADDEPTSPATTPGDLNGDGEVDASDLTILARHVGKVETMEDETALANADVTGDGNVDASDLTKLAQYVGKIISSLD
ncbi:MAG: leucine-rich repeat protein [Oscillospiraceae bacterium]|nr:leucine-rich repeat protein [Oscillospiraceae bacterium]